MFTKFQVDWTSTSSKTTLTKNFNLKRDGRTDGRTNERRHRPENIMPLYYRRWGIKINFKVSNSFNCNSLELVFRIFIPIDF